MQWKERGFEDPSSLVSGPQQIQPEMPHHLHGIVISFQPQLLSLLFNHPNDIFVTRITTANSSIRSMKLRTTATDCIAHCRSAVALRGLSHPSPQTNESAVQRPSYAHRRHFRLQDRSHSAGTQPKFSLLFATHCKYRIQWISDARYHKDFIQAAADR